MFRKLVEPLPTPGLVIGDSGATEAGAAGAFSAGGFTSGDAGAFSGAGDGAFSAGVFGGTIGAGGLVGLGTAAAGFTVGVPAAAGCCVDPGEEELCNALVAHE